jgi:hypothetical protein
MTREGCFVPRQSLKHLLEHDFDTLSARDKLRVASAMLCYGGYRTPLDLVYKSELPLCGARCYDGLRARIKPPVTPRPAATSATPAVVCMVG